MTNQQPKRGILKLISDPYSEWTSTPIDGYEVFAKWMDAQLSLLEARYAGWETLGYAHWRQTHNGRRESLSSEAAE